MDIPENYPLNHCYHNLDWKVIGYASDFPQGCIEPSHHHDRAQLLYAISGVARVRTSEGIWMAPPTRAVWVPPGVVHDLKYVSHVKSGSLYIKPNARPSLPKHCKVIEVSALLHHIIRELISFDPEQKIGNREKRLMELALDELDELPIKALQLLTPSDPEINNLCEKILAHLDQEVTLNDCAQFLNISSKTFSRRFQNDLNMTFGNWLRKAKVLGSLEMLAEGQSVMEVALNLGYDSPSAFTAVFKRILGVSPSVYFGRKSPITTPFDKK